MMKPACIIRKYEVNIFWKFQFNPITAEMIKKVDKGMNNFIQNNDKNCYLWLNIDNGDQRFSCLR